MTYRGRDAVDNLAGGSGLEINGPGAHLAVRARDIELEPSIRHRLGHQTSQSNARAKNFQV